MAWPFMDGTIGTSLVQMAVQLVVAWLNWHFTLKYSVQVQFSCSSIAEVCMSDNRMAPVECSKVGPGLTYWSVGFMCSSAT